MSLKQTPITVKDFINLVGRLGVECVGRHANGSSWLLPDGRLCAELHNGVEWTYVLVTDKAN